LASNSLSKQSLKHNNENQRSRRPRQTDINRSNENRIVDNMKLPVLKENRKSKMKGRNKSKLIEPAIIHSTDENGSNQAQLQSRRRGRKRKLPPEKHINNKASRASKKLLKDKATADIRCGKCLNTSTVYPNVHKFKDHVIREHGGVAKPLGESQEYQSEEELHAALKDAFSTKRQIPCYQCMQKKFTSFTGLKMHLLTCGKSKEECNVSTYPSYYNPKYKYICA